MCRAAFCIALALCIAAAPARAQQPTPPPGAADSVNVEPAARKVATFAQAKQLLVSHQPSLKQQLAALRRAEAQVEQAFSGLMPRFEVGLGADYAFVRRPVLSAETLVLDGRSFVPNATAALSITFSLARLTLLDAAQQLVAAESRGLAAQRHQLIGALAGALLGLLGAERVAARNVAGYAAAEERMRLTQRLLEVGRITAVDALRFTQDLSEAQSERVSAVEALSQAREALGSALGLPEAVALDENFDALALLSAAGSGCRPIASLTARPDRLAAAERVAQAQTSVRAARQAYLPELRLTSLYSARLSPGFETAFLGSRELVHDWGARANLVWTAFDGGARAAELLRSEAELVRQRALEQQVVIDTELEQRRAQRLLSVSQANLAAAEASVDAARKIDGLSRKALELGTASALEVVDAARRLRGVEITLALREVEALSAQVRAHMALAICE